MNNYRQMHLIPPALYAKLMNEVGTSAASANSEGKCLNINQLNSIQNESGAKVFISQKPEVQTTHTHMPMVNDVDRDQPNDVGVNASAAFNGNSSFNGNNTAADNNSTINDENERDFDLSNRNETSHTVDSAILQGVKRQTSGDASFEFPAKKKIRSSKGFKEILSNSLFAKEPEKGYPFDRFSTSLPVSKEPTNQFASALPVNEGFAQVYPNKDATQDLTLHLNETQDKSTAVIDDPANEREEQVNISANGVHADPVQHEPAPIDDTEFVPTHASTPTPRKEPAFVFPTKPAVKRRFGPRSKEEVITHEKEENVPVAKVSKKKTDKARQALMNKLVQSGVLARNTRSRQSRKPASPMKSKQDDDDEYEDVDDEETQPPNVVPQVQVQDDDIPQVRKRGTKRGSGYEYKTAVRPKRNMRFDDRSKTFPQVQVQNEAPEIVDIAQVVKKGTKRGSGYEYKTAVRPKKNKWFGEMSKAVKRSNANTSTNSPQKKKNASYVMF